MISKLSSRSPGTTAGPVSPPFRRPSRLSTSKPPLTFSAPLAWHLAHFVTSTGRILVSKNLSCSGLIGCSATASRVDLGRGEVVTGAWSAAAFFLARPPLANGPIPPPLGPPGRIWLIRRNSTEGQEPVMIGVEPLENRLGPRGRLLGRRFLEASPVHEQLAEFVERELAIEVAVA